MRALVVVVFPDKLVEETFSMFTSDTDTHPVKLADIPLMWRLTDRVTVLDSELGYTRDIYKPNGAVLSSVLLPQRSLHTLVARSDTQQVVGQFRLHDNDDHAHIVYLAPHLEDQDQDDVWLHLLDAMARKAGKHNVRSLVAEVDENSHLFETMRSAGYSVYARQQIWRHLPGDYVSTRRKINLTKETESDGLKIQSLIARTVPPIVQQIIGPPVDLNGWVYRQNDKVEGYVAVSEGKYGIYLIPCFHPDVMEDLEDIICTLVQKMTDIDKLPLYVCVRRYQKWIALALENMRFEPGPRQAVMVKHIAARVRHAEFEITHPVKAAVKSVKTSSNSYKSKTGNRN